MDTLAAPTAPASGERGRSHLRWVAIAALALVIDLVDNFWVTSLRGAVGAIEQVQEPFNAWVRASTLMFPLYLLAVAAAAVIGRRLVRNVRFDVVRSMIVGLLVVAATMLVGIGALTVNAVRDYHAQSAELAVMHATHHSATSTGDSAHADHAAGASTAGCDALCQERRATLDVDKRAVGYGTVVLLISNARARRVPRRPVGRSPVEPGHSDDTPGPTEPPPSARAAAASPSGSAPAAVLPDESVVLRTQMAACVRSRTPMRLKIRPQ